MTPDLEVGKTFRETFGDGFVVVLAAIWSIAGISQLGLGTLSLEGIGSLSSTIYSLGGISITLASALALIAPILAYLMNNKDLGDLNNYQTGAALLTVALVTAVTISPPLQDYLAVNAGVAWIYFLFEGLGFFGIAGLETLEKDVIGGWTP